MIPQITGHQFSERVQCCIKATNEGIRIRSFLENIQTDEAKRNKDVRRLSDAHPDIFVAKTPVQYKEKIYYEIIYKFDNGLASCFLLRPKPKSCKGNCPYSVSL